MKDIKNIQTLESSKKLAIKLTEEQIGPFPISVESLWFDEDGSYLRLKSTPFFVDEISFDDVLSLVEVEPDLYMVDKVVAPSSNSTVWLLIRNDSEGEKLLDTIIKLGCGVEGGVLHGYYAINIPSTVQFNDVATLLNLALDSASISVDYPSIRHAQT